MHVSVNGVRLFFDVEGAKFVPVIRDAWLRLAMPVYTRIPRDPDMALHWFARPDVAHLVQFERFAATA